MNEQKFNLYLTILKIALVGIGVVSSLLLIGGPNVNQELQEVEAFRDGAKMAVAINYTIGIILSGVGLIFLFFFVQLATQTKKTLMSIIGLVIALVVYLVFSAVGTSDTSATLQLKNAVSDGTVATTTAGLYTVGLAIFVGVAAIVIMPIINRFK
jgi:hypothetical protein